MRKRLLSILLCLVMVMGLLPTAVLAAGPMRVGTMVVTQTYRFYVSEVTETATPYHTETIQSGETLPDPGVPAGDGEFLGWYVGTEKLSFGEKTFSESSTVDVVARFQGVNYFYFMSGTGDDAIVAATKVLHEGDTDINDFSDVVVPMTPTQGVTGWYTDKRLTESVTSLSFHAGRSVTYLYPEIGDGFWLTFVSNGGTYTSPRFCTGTASAPTAPSKYGYDFDGWYTDEEPSVPADFSSITSACTLYAKWTPKTDTKYTVVHWWENADDDDYSYHDSESLTGTTEGTTAAVAKAYDGFTAQPITQQTIAGDGSTIVNVYYKRNVYEVKFYSYIVDNGFWQIGEEMPEKKITAKYGAEICDKWPGGIWILLTDKFKDGNGFKHFVDKAEYDMYFDGSEEYQANLREMPLGGADYWYTNMNSPSTAEYYLETLTAGEYELDHTDTGATGGSVISPADSYGITGFTFDYYVPGVWTEKEKDLYPHATCDDYKDKKWDGSAFYYTRNTYNVVYMNHSENPGYQVSYKYEADISGAGEYVPSVPSGVPENYVFDGWYYNKELNVPCNFNGRTMPANNITVYAKWVPPVCKVTFVAYGKELSTSANVLYGEKLAETQIPAVTEQESDVFYGWAYDEAGTQPFNSETSITKDLVLYAQLSNQNGYTVAYDANGGTGTVPTDLHHYAMNKAAMALSGSSLTAPTGKVFLAWNTASDGTGTNYYPGSSVPVTGNITLYAIWGDKTPIITLTYHANGGTGADIVESYANNASVTLKGAEAFTRTGYTLTGWNTQADGTGTAFSLGAGALVNNIGCNDLYAVWSKNSSGGGGGGNKKPVVIPDEVPTGLNGDDHYAYIVGYPDSTVHPQNGITRAEVATIFFRLLTDEVRNKNSTKTNSYSDVASTDWYNHAVSTLSAMDIIKGDTHGKFNPNAPITRAEFAAIAARFDDKANTTTADFSDIASHWAKDEISAAANNGWINGYTDGTFRPNNNISRAEAMTLVNRVLKRLPETAEDLHDDMIKWTDNSDTSKWYYLAVQEATNSHYYETKNTQYEKWTKLRETRDWTELEK